MPDSTTDIRKKIDRFISDHAYDVYKSKDLPDKEQDEEQLRLHKIYTEELEALIKQEKLGLLERLEKKAGWYSQRFNDKARKDGIEDTLIPLSAIQAEKDKLK